MVEQQAQAVTVVVAERLVSRTCCRDLEGPNRREILPIGSDRASVCIEGAWVHARASLTALGRERLGSWLSDLRIHAVIPEADWILATRVSGVFCWDAPCGAHWLCQRVEGVICALSRVAQSSPGAVEAWMFREGLAAQPEPVDVSNIPWLGGKP